LVHDSSTLSGHADSLAHPEPMSAFLFVALDARRPLAATTRLALEGSDLVEIGRGAPRGVIHDGARVELRLDDSRVSRNHVRLLRQGQAWVIEDRGSKNGTGVMGARLEGARVLADGDVIEVGHTFLVFRGRNRSFGAGDLQLRPDDARAAGLATVMPGLAHHFHQLEQVARAGTSIALVGETGTGKEVMARACHTLFGRPGPFVAVNCGALPQGLVEAEFFGWKKGAFSGANEDRIGHLRRADGGTLFLDEFTELPRVSQASLLRVLQEREVAPLGSRTAVKLDLCLIVSTNRDVPRLVQEGKLRPDLWARVAGFPLRIPALRHRREDAGLVVASLLGRLAGARASEVGLTLESARRIMTGAWRTNVRGLENALRVALAAGGAGAETLLDVRGDDHVLGPPLEGSLHDEPPSSIIRLATPLPPPPAATKLPEERGFADSRPPLDGLWIERRDQLVALLDKHDGNVTAVARELGHDRVTIYAWLRRVGIEASRFRG
jgi:transcriptional regulator with GAF, ATPase, and Fis domain